MMLAKAASLRDFPSFNRNNGFHHHLALCSRPRRTLPSTPRSSNLKHVVFSQKNGNGAPDPSSEEDVENQRQKAEINLLTRLIVQYPGARGSLAVAVGYLAHVDPLGTLRWNSHDAFVGSTLALLPTLFDLLILLPNWEPQKTIKTMKLLLPREVAEKMKERGDITIIDRPVGGIDKSAMLPHDQRSDDQASSADMVQVERTMMVRADQHPARDALQSIQMGRTMNNIGRALSPSSEALLLFLVHVSEEMLYRGVLLVLVVKWCTDNLYYAGADDSVILPWLWNIEIATPELGAVMGASLLTLGAVGLLVQRELFPLRILENAKEKIEEYSSRNGKYNQANKVTQTAPRQDDQNGDDKKAKVANLLEKLRSNVVIQQRWIVVFEASIEFLQWSTLSTSFLLTGNILAPIIGSMVNDAIYSIAQRYKHQSLRKMMVEKSESNSERSKQTALLLAAVREHRKKKLKTPPAESTRSNDDVTNPNNDGKH